MDGSTQNLKIVRMAEVASKVALQKSTIYGMIQAGTFPAPFKIAPGGRASGWLLADIEKWLASRSQKGGE